MARPIEIADGGVVQLVNGAAQIATDQIGPNSAVFLAGQDQNVTGFLRVTGRQRYTGFAIASSVATDSGHVAWFIAEPAGSSE